MNIKLADGKTYKRGDGTTETVGGTTKNHPDLVWTIQGNWYIRETGRFISYSAKAGAYAPMPMPTWRDIVEEVSAP